MSRQLERSDIISPVVVERFAQAFEKRYEIGRDVIAAVFAGDYQTGLMHGAVAQPGTNVRNPNVSQSQQRAAQTVGAGNWQEKMHQAVTADDRGEAQMRKQILESLPAKEPESETEDA